MPILIDEGTDILEIAKLLAHRITNEVVEAGDKPDTSVQQLDDSRLALIFEYLVQEVRRRVANGRSTVPAIEIRQWVSSHSPHDRYVELSKRYEPNGQA